MGTRHHERLQARISSKFICDQFRGEVFRDRKNLRARYAEEECDGVEYIAKDELEGEVVDSESLSYPSKESVDPKK